MRLMEKTKNHYKQFIEREFETRLRKNPSYSLRAFARDIGMQASKLSEVLRGIRGLSKLTAQKIIKEIKLSEDEGVLFLNLVDLHQKKNKLLQRQAEEKLRSLGSMDGYGELNLERFKIISDWYHLSILELTSLEVFESNPSWIAGRLGISTKEASSAIERLLDFGLLERKEDGSLHQTHINLATPSGIPSREIREHHSQILMKADEALEKVDMVERDFSAITLAFNTDQMEEVRAELKNIRRLLGQKIQDKPNKNRIYCLAMQFFPLDNK